MVASLARENAFGAEKLPLKYKTLHFSESLDCPQTPSAVLQLPFPLLFMWVECLPYLILQLNTSFFLTSQKASRCKTCFSNAKILVKSPFLRFLLVHFKTDVCIFQLQTLPTLGPLFHSCSDFKHT